MKFAIMESIITPGGHEIDYDRILVEELKALGHEVEFYVPEKHLFKWNYDAPVNYLRGTGVTYAGARGLTKIWRSAKREINRQRWYKQMFELAAEKRFDAVIFPSATYRYLRALKHNILKNAPLPVLFVIHGLTPSETPLLFGQMEKLPLNPNIKILVQTFAPQHFADNKLTNLYHCPPPNYIPRDITPPLDAGKPAVLKMGFFGQYRKEKNVEPFLDAFVACNFKRPVKLIVQGATMTQRDSDDFERIMEKYKQHHEIMEFWHRPLIGAEWQEAIASVDAVVMPYGAERYRYHTSAILSTAIGFKKPVIIADNINPEVLSAYNIGCVFKVSDMLALKQAVEEFVNTYDDKFAVYNTEVARAYADFSPRKLVEKIVEISK